ncbi:hypothetical protein DFH08DRAFT_943630 [Mycena albidolilacea]|uniref:Uncharacterized protein n=1 Tax=Mycena albidolilacea TaxID=1033008 RepID=A0AAD7ECW9_9AGAR|nr:hypothetical protein DFH08DRAFT_943630 [Mycena albidolilacea]
MSGSGATYYDEELKYLYRLLKNLPDVIPEGNPHGFTNYVPDPQKTKDFGCTKSVVSQVLKSSFGWRDVSSARQLTDQVLGLLPGLKAFFLSTFGKLAVTNIIAVITIIKNILLLLEKQPPRNRLSRVILRSPLEKTQSKGAADNRKVKTLAVVDDHDIDFAESRLWLWELLLLLESRLDAPSHLIPTPSYWLQLFFNFRIVRHILTSSRCASAVHLSYARLRYEYIAVHLSCARLSILLTPIHYIDAKEKEWTLYKESKTFVTNFHAQLSLRRFHNLIPKCPLPAWFLCGPNATSQPITTMPSGRFAIASLEDIRRNQVQITAQVDFKTVGYSDTRSSGTTAWGNQPILYSMSLTIGENELVSSRRKDVDESETSGSGVGGQFCLLVFSL